MPRTSLTSLVPKGGSDKVDGAVPVVSGQQVGGHLLQHANLAGQPADQLPQQGHLPGVRLGQGQQRRRPGRGLH